VTPDVSSTTTAAGLRVVAVELPHLHTATVVAYVRTGPRFESPTDNGLSHFVEHMLFRGTERYPSSYEINFAIENLGGTLYAETGRDHSLYSIELDPALLGEGLALFGELLCRPRFGDLELERKLILEELNEDYSERGVEINGDDIARELVFGRHPLGQRIIGPRDNVRRFADDDVRRHFTRHYCAANMILTVAGPVRGPEVLALAERHLAALPAGEAVDSAPVAAAQNAPILRYVSDRGTQSDVNVVLRALPELDRDYPALLALSRIIDDGMSTRLHYRIADRKALAYSVGAGLDTFHDAGLLEITAETAHAKVPALVAEILALLAELRAEPVAEAELSKLKRRYRYDLVGAIDDAGAMAGWFGGGAMYCAPPTLDERLAQVEAISAADIRAVAERIARPENLVVVVVGSLTRARQAELRAAVDGWGG
jgi:predicted Zn-dependent peptidase